MRLPLSSHNRDSAHGKKSRLAAIHLGFALTGVVTTMLGPVLPLLSAQWRLNDVQAGRLFTAQFVAAVSGSLIAGRVLARRGSAWTVGIGMLLVAAGVSATAAGSAAVGIAGICVFGLGLGFAIPATNLLIAEIVPEKRVAALNILNFSWTVGALAGPLLIASAERSIGFQAFALLLCAAFAIIAVFEFALLPRAAGATASLIREGRLPAEKRIEFAVLACLFLILYVGVENGFSGWLSVIAGRVHHAQVPTAAIVQSSFWGAILLGRLLAPMIVRVLAPAKLVKLGLAGAAVGIAAAAAAPHLGEFEAGVVLCGIGMAALFPTVVGIFTGWYGTGGAGTIVLGLSGVGGAVVPLAVGAVAAHAGSLRTGLMVNFLCVLLAFLTFRRLQAVVRSHRVDSAAA